MIKAVIFDLDDTLISERQYIESGYKFISRYLSSYLKITEVIVYNSLIDLFNESPINVFNRFYESIGLSYGEQQIRQLVDLYRKHAPNIDFFDDVLPFVSTLKSRRIKTGIITDGYKLSQQQKLKAVNAYKYFDEIIVTDEIGPNYWKPHPRAFEIMSEKLNIRYEEMIYVGDNPSKDFYISSIYPIQTIRIIRDAGVHKNKEYYKQIREKYCVNSLRELRI